MKGALSHFVKQHQAWRRSGFQIQPAKSGRVAYSLCQGHTSGPSLRGVQYLPNIRICPFESKLRDELIVDIAPWRDLRVVIEFDCSGLHYS
jgi:hypothetical protein